MASEPLTFAILLLGAIFIMGQSAVADLANSPTFQKLQQGFEVPEVEKTLAALTSSQTKNSVYWVETAITSGPKEGEILTDGSQIVFEFKGTASPMETGQKITYQVKLDGVDAKWKTNSSGKATYEVKAGTNRYTFWVRAKYRNIYDSSPAKATFTVRVSNNYNKVKVTSVSHSSITVKAQLSSDSERINITGWKLKTRKGEIAIGKGVEIFAPGSSLLEKDLLLKKGDLMNIMSASDPFGTRKIFKTNKCFGYLKDSYSNFPSTLSMTKICPKVDKTKIWSYSKDCQNSIKKLESCKPLETDVYKNLSVYFESGCQSYIDNYTAQYLNYNGCVRNYFRDKDFLKNYWYYYAGYDIACSCEDYVYIYDSNGLLVNRFLYKL
jgi:hypothetical protein